MLNIEQIDLTRSYESNNAEIKAVKSYIYRLVDELGFRLNNLETVDVQSTASEMAEDELETAIVPLIKKGTLNGYIDIYGDLDIGSDRIVIGVETFDIDNTHAVRCTVTSYEQYQSLHFEINDRGTSVPITNEPHVSVTYYYIDIADINELLTAGTTGSGSGSGTSNYNDLDNKPQINGVTLTGDKTTSELHISLPAVIPFAQVDSTSTATSYTATVPEITELEDGVCVMLKNGVITSKSGFTININGLGAKPVYNNLAEETRDTTIFNVAYTMLFVYDSTRVAGGCWICYRGYDSNTNTIGYQLRTNNMSLPMSSEVYQYRLLFTSADGNHFVPANNSNKTNATSIRDVVTEKIDPFGDIRYYGTKTALSAGARPAAAYLWQQYNITLGYSFNRTGEALTLTSWLPVYLKCTPQDDGSAIIDPNEPYTQALPNTDNGKIYILLGIATDATTMELLIDHPVYYYKDGTIRQWSNAPSHDKILNSEIETIMAS